MLGSIPDGQRARSLWISEGLTDYYASVQLVRAELMTPGEYLIRLSDAISGYAKVFSNSKAFICFGTVFLEGVLFYGATPAFQLRTFCVHVQACVSTDLANLP